MIQALITIPIVWDCALIRVMYTPVVFIVGHWWAGDGNTPWRIPVLPIRTLWLYTSRITIDESIWALTHIIEGIVHLPTTTSRYFITFIYARECTCRANTSIYTAIPYLPIIACNHWRNTCILIPNLIIWTYACSNAIIPDPSIITRVINAVISIIDSILWAYTLPNILIPFCTTCALLDYFTSITIPHCAPRTLARQCRLIPNLPIGTSHTISCVPFCTSSTIAFQSVNIPQLSSMAYRLDSTLPSIPVLPRGTDALLYCLIPHSISRTIIGLVTEQPCPLVSCWAQARFGT